MHKLWSFVKNGGWVILLAAAFFVGGVAKYVVVPILNGHLHHFVGNGKTVSSYHFSLHPCLVPRGQIIASGQYKDALVAFDKPRFITPARVKRLNQKEIESGKFLLPPDLVIGVFLHGIARAYPTRILGWHDAVNDTIGGKKILVSFDGWCNSAAVYDRTVAGHVLRFGYSGLVYNSSALLYDKQPTDARESLWSPLLGKAIAGQAAGERLRLRPCLLVSYGAWVKLHPHTMVLRRMPGMRDAYRKAPFSAYLFNPSSLHFPVAPLVRSSYPIKSEVLALRMGHRWHVFPFPALLQAAHGRSTMSLAVGGQRLQLVFGRAPRTIAVVSRPAPPVIYSLLFAWYAQHPHVPLEK